MWKSWVIITETKENFILDYLLLTILFRLLKFRSTQLERTATTITTIPFEIETPVCWRSFPLVSKCLSRFLHFISPRSLIHKVRQTTWPFHVHSPAKSLSSLRSPFSFLPSFPPSSYPLFPFSLLVPFGGSLFSRYRSSSRSFSLMFENQPSSSLFSLPQCLSSFFIFASLSLSLSMATSSPRRHPRSTLFIRFYGLIHAHCGIICDQTGNGSILGLETNTRGWSDFHFQAYISGDIHRGESNE